MSAALTFIVCEALILGIGAVAGIAWERRRAARALTFAERLSADSMEKARAKFGHVRFSERGVASVDSAELLRQPKVREQYAAAHRIVRNRQGETDDSAVYAVGTPRTAPAHTADCPPNSADCPATPGIARAARVGPRP